VEGSFSPQTPDVSADVETQTTSFCGGCHKIPNPAYFARDRWHEEVERGFRFHATSSRVDLSPPPLSEVAAYFRERAPAELAIASPKNLPGGAARFLSTAVAPADGGGPSPSIAFVAHVRLAEDAPPSLLACDMVSGELLAIDPAAEPLRARRLAGVGHPSHVAACDLDADGVTDLVVADLGSYLPEDHDRGRVVWLRNAGDGSYEPSVLLDGVGRVADARPGDFDGDGDQDLIVAEFGWQATGAIRLLTNEGPPGERPKFTSIMIDERHGAIHVPVLDWDGDGRDDFLALVSQEHETIELRRGREGGGFDRDIVNPPEDPAFGSTGIEAADLDGDGDRDILYTNGDTLDSHELKPYHAIHWVENLDGAGWKVRELTAMPGAHRALAADLDGDGDLDVAAAAMLPARLFDDRNRHEEFDSLVWLEQVRPGEFERHLIERGSCHHAAMELADFDGDGRIDLAVGNFQKPADPSPVSIWRNLAAGPSVAYADCP